MNGVFGGPVVKAIYNNQAIYAIVLAGIFMIVAAISTFYVQDAVAINMKDKR